MERKRKSAFSFRKLDNKYRMRGDKAVFRAQLETYKFYRDKVDVVAEKFNKFNN